jgi:hypothetical protein
LYNEVSITPLLLTPTDIRRSSGSIENLVDDGDFLRALEVGAGLRSRQRTSYKDLAALGRVEVLTGRFDSARENLQAALKLNPPFTAYGEIAWDLSQLEYLARNYGASAQWALVATSHGTTVKQWHVELLRSLAQHETIRIFGPGTARVNIATERPEIPRFDVVVNGDHEIRAAIDTGAVQTIVSNSFANRSNIKRLGSFTGTFYGLLGEPIEVAFGIIDSLQFGGMQILNVPVAIMPDRELNFVVRNREPFRMDMLLGTSLLKEFRIELDFRARSATFVHLLPSQRVPSANQNLFFINFQPYVQTSINRKAWHLFILDTGSEVTFLNESKISGTGVRNLPKLHGALLQGLGGAQKSGAKVENVEIGVDRWAGTFKTIPLYDTERSQAVGILGQNLLKHFRVVIDFGTMRVDLHRDRIIPQ